MKKITLFLLTAIIVFGCTKSSLRPTGTVALNMLTLLLCNYNL